MSMDEDACDVGGWKLEDENGRVIVCLSEFYANAREQL